MNTRKRPVTNCNAERVASSQVAFYRQLHLDPLSAFKKFVPTKEEYAAHGKKSLEKKNNRRNAITQSMLGKEVPALHICKEKPQGLIELER